MGEGARALLFERLVDRDPRARAEARPLRTHPPAGLRASVLRRLDLLLNTRATRPRPAAGPLTVLDYGLPDFSALHVSDAGVRTRLEHDIREAIESFEPRLEVARVEVAFAPGNERSLRVALTGRIRGERTTEPVSFLIPLTGEGTPQETS